MFPQSIYQCCRGAQVWPAWISFGAGWNWLCSTWGQLLVSFHRSHLCTIPSFVKSNTLWLGIYPPTVSALGNCLKLLKERNHQNYLGTSPFITHSVGGTRAAWSTKKARGKFFLGKSPSLLEYYKFWKIFLISLLHKAWDAFASHKKGTMTQRNRKNAATSAGWIPTSQKTLDLTEVWAHPTTASPAIPPFAIPPEFPGLALRDGDSETFPDRITCVWMFPYCGHWQSASRVQKLYPAILVGY